MKSSGLLSPVRISFFVIVAVFALATRPLTSRKRNRWQRCLGLAPVGRRLLHQQRGSKRLLPLHHQLPVQRPGGRITVDREAELVEQSERLQELPREDRSLGRGRDDAWVTEEQAGHGVLGQVHAGDAKAEQ